MKPILLSRDNFRESTFTRDNYLCVICKAPAVDAHHIIERRLFSDGGYYLDNGASVCQKHHIEAEQTTLSCDEIRSAAGIQKIVIPEHFYSDYEYDKWGNIVQPNGTRLKGELFYDESVQKILEKGNVLDLFVKYVKYPRTMHLPNSTLGKDGRMLKDDSEFIGKRVVVSVKLDGENCVSGETILQTDSGNKSIKEICESKFFGKVLSKNIFTNELEYQSILAHNVSIEKNTDEWFKIELEDGSHLEITGEHYVFLPEYACYRKVKDLKESDEIDFYLKTG